jgi:hypothetical protein
MPQFACISLATLHNYEAPFSFVHAARDATNYVRATESAPSTVQRDGRSG